MMKFSLIFLTFLIFLGCKKSDTNTSSPIVEGPTAILSGVDSIRVGDSTKLSFTLTGTAPFKLVYSDGSSNITADNIQSSTFSVYVKPTKTSVYKPVSINDKNKSGTVSGEFNVWVQSQFVSKSPNYSSINSTVGNIQNNKYFRGAYYHIDEIKSNFTFTLIDDIYGKSTYQIGDHTYVFFDYNNDGYLDLFGWLFNLTPVSGRFPGKYILIDNVNSNKRKISFFNSDISIPSGMELNDFNKDGIKDVVFYSYNTHTDIGGQANNPSKPVKVLLFDKNGNFKETNATIPLTVHDMASGDINNDGAADMVVWQYGEVGGIYKPRIYMNNGNGTFNEAPTSNINGLQEILNTRSNGINALTTELIDLNDDGNLDLIFSTTIGGVEWDYVYHNDQALFKLPQQRILWGNGNGKFDIVNNFTDLPNSIIEEWSKTQPTANDAVNTFNKNSKLALGFNFLDFNNDGKLDILTVITPHYKGYILQLHQNMGNKTFKDVTAEIISNYNGPLRGINNVGINGDIPNFYEIRPYDIDSDGDFDLIPHGVTCWDFYTYPKNVYWENVGGKFNLRK